MVLLLLRRQAPNNSRSEVLVLRGDIVSVASSAGAVAVIEYAVAVCVCCVDAAR